MSESLPEAPKIIRVTAGVPPKIIRVTAGGAVSPGVRARARALPAARGAATFL